MLLTARERYRLLDVLPVQESIENLRILHDLKMALSLSEDEMAKYHRRDPDTGKISEFLSAAGLAEEAEIPIGEKAMDICIAALRAASQAKRLTEFHISVYDKFIKKSE